MKEILVKCEQCGVKFYKSFSEIKRMEVRNQKRHFCNVRCLSLYGNLSKKDKANERLIEYSKNPKLCLNCNSIIPFEDKSWKKYCSSRCCAIYTQKSGGHCKWSIEDKKRLSILARNNSNFYKCNLGKKRVPDTILKCRSCNKDFIQVATRIKHNKTQTCSKECRNKIQSVIVLNHYKNGKLVYGGTTKWLRYKNIKVQGSYEYRTCILLDKWAALQKIKRWEYTNDRFRYIGTDGKHHNYLMDFKIWNPDESFYYLEIKGYEKENDKLKWESVRREGHQLVVWFNDDLKKEENNLMVPVA